jgi:hypothetical protein
MASLRKRYVDRIEAGPRQDEPPVMAPPVSAAKLPDAVEPKSAEPLVVENPDPVRKAEKDAIALQLRLREMERAEVLQKEAIERHQQQPPHAADARDDPYLQPPGQRGWWQGRKAEYAVDPQLVFEHENRNQQSPLGNQLGYGSIGHSPSQTPYNGPAPLAPPLSVLRRRGVDELIGDAGYPWLNFQASHYLRTRPQ